MNDLSTMIQKRPFARPLFFWISGILLYFYSSLSWLVCGLAAWIILFLFFLGRSWIGSPGHRFSYETRWVWGMAVSVLVMALAIEVSALAYWRAEYIPRSVSFWEGRAIHAQRSLVDGFDRLHLPDEEKSILATLTLGYKRSMRQETRERFSLAGVSHILAVSGFHVSVVSGFLSFLCSFMSRWWIGRWIRYLFLIGGIWCFAFITGLASSSVRAALMLSLYLTGRQLRRSTNSYNTLAAAAFCMLVYNPFYLFDLGFQLSYLAVFFILFLTPRLKGWIAVRNPLLAQPWAWISVSIAAQLGTVGLCLYYFGYFSIVFLFTNPPVIVLATLLIPLAFLWMVYPVGWVGQDALQGLVEALVRFMMRVVEVFGELPFASMGWVFGFWDLLGSYLMLLLVMVYIRVRNIKVLLTALLVFLALLLEHLIQRFLVVMD